MKHVVHVVVTNSFAGTERYVCTLANETARRDWQVTVIGGAPDQMRAELSARVRWLPGATLVQALLSLARLGRVDVCHAHLTYAELVAAVLRRGHRGRVVSTRHIAAPRGSSRLGAVIGPWIARRLDVEMAISHYVAGRMEREPDVVIHTGVASRESLWRPESRKVLVLQRLEREKRTDVAIEAWRLSGLGQEGWTLEIVGDGRMRAALERQVASQSIPGVRFVGAVDHARPHLATAGLLLAPTPVEAMGLSVLEAMSAGVPVVAAAGGGHLESIGAATPGALFAVDDADHAARLIRAMAQEAPMRSSTSAAGQEEQRRRFTVQGMATKTLAVYSAGESSGAESSVDVPANTTAHSGVGPETCVDEAPSTVGGTGSE